MQRADLETELDEVRVRGYATNDVRNTSAAGDFLSIAVPIRKDGTVIPALSIAASAQPTTDSWRERAVKELQRSAKSLERQIEVPELPSYASASGR